MAQLRIVGALEFLATAYSKDHKPLWGMSFFDLFHAPPDTETRTPEQITADIMRKAAE